jgi:hypothetical protein
MSYTQYIYTTTLFGQSVWPSSGSYTKYVKDFFRKRLPSYKQCLSHFVIVSLLFQILE